VTGIPRHLTEYRKKLNGFPFHLALHTLTKSFPSHRHDFFEFSLVVEGQGTETIDGVTHLMEPGTFTFIMPFQVHQIDVPDGGRLRLLNCNFGMELLFGVNVHYRFTSFLLNSHGQFPSYIRLKADRYAHFHQLLTRMLHEYQEGDEWVKEMLLMKLSEVLIAFYRHHQALSGTGQIIPSLSANTAETPAADGPEESQPPKDTLNIWNILHYIHQHYLDNITLASVSDQFHINPSYLSMMIKKHTGHKFMKHLHDLRIRHACTLLQSTDMNIIEISYEAGYGSYNSFTRIFHQTKGMSPSDYRKSCSRSG
jgi:AraC-like DNA-binding protein/mannose-6-phosphate isomerase-like protein (cupin superfamily)